RVAWRRDEGSSDDLPRGARPAARVRPGRAPRRTGAGPRTASGGLRGMPARDGRAATGRGDDELLASPGLPAPGARRSGRARALRGRAGEAVETSSLATGRAHAGCCDA